MAIELAIRAAKAGSMDLVEEMLNDQSFAEMLEGAGISKDQIAGKTNELINILQQAEKKYNKYYNRATSSKYGAGLAQVLTELDMSVSMYDKLIKDIDSTIQENIEKNI